MVTVLFLCLVYVTGLYPFLESLGFGLPLLVCLSIVDVVLMSQCVAGRRK